MYSLTGLISFPVRDLREVSSRQRDQLLLMQVIISTCNSSSWLQSYIHILTSCTTCTKYSRPTTSSRPGESPETTYLHEKDLQNFPDLTSFRHMYVSPET